MARRTAPNRSSSQSYETSIFAAKVELNQVPSMSYPHSTESSAFRIKNAPPTPSSSKERNPESA